MIWPTIGILSSAALLAWLFWRATRPTEKDPSQSYIAELRKAKALREANKGLPHA